jgi:hypothetical protein
MAKRIKKELKTPSQTIQECLDKNPFIDGKTNTTFSIAQAWASKISDKITKEFVNHEVNQHIESAENHPAFAVSWTIKERK